MGQWLRSGGGCQRTSAGELHRPPHDRRGEPCVPATDRRVLGEQIRTLTLCPGSFFIYIFLSEQKKNHLIEMVELREIVLRSWILRWLALSNHRPSRFFHIRIFRLVFRVLVCHFPSSARCSFRKTIEHPWTFSKLVILSKWCTVFPR